MLLVVLVFAIGFLIFVRPIFATAGPTQISPSSGSTVSSSTLTWQAPSYQLYTTYPYRVQVDDDQNFGSANKDYYTDNTSYSPSLTYGLWYWKVKAKDSSSNWSDWSSIWSFILTTAPSPSPSPSSSPSPSVSSDFTISNVPSEINSDQSFSANVNVSLPNNSATVFYLKGAFKKSDSSNYFGQTKVAGKWIGNSESYSNQYQITTDSSGLWSGSLEVSPDILDSGYDGSGQYIFKVGRYNSNGSGPTWSNEKYININAKEIEGDNSPIGLPVVSPTTKSKSKIQETKKDLTDAVYSLENYRKNSSVAGIQQEATPNAKFAGSKFPNLFLIIGGILVTLGIGSTSYIIFRKWKSI